jgi:hypothetical protein
VYRKVVQALHPVLEKSPKLCTTETQNTSTHNSKKVVVHSVTVPQFVIMVKTGDSSPSLKCPFKLEAFVVI